MFRYSEALKTIDEADTSILSNITKVNMYKFITIYFKLSVKYTVSFNNAFTMHTLVTMQVVVVLFHQQDLK